MIRNTVVTFSLGSGVHKSIVFRLQHLSMVKYNISTAKNSRYPELPT